MKFLAIIPARYASTRFPGKPLVDIGGRSMIQRVYERCSAVFEHCYVATDDQRIESAVINFGGRVVMTSVEHRSGTDRAGEALLTVERLTGERFDAVVNIQGDEPFIATSQLEQLRELLQNPQAQIATLVKPFDRDEDIANPNSPKVVLGVDGRALYFSRSVIPFLRGVDPAQWSERHTYYKHVGLYGYRRDVLLSITAMEPSELEMAESLEQLRWLENGVVILTGVTHMPSYAIDTPADLIALGDLSCDLFQI